MTTTKINQTIAEACGWDFDPSEAHAWGSRGRWCKSPTGKMMFRHNIPNYHADLNAIHEAEKVLTDEQYAAPLGVALFEDFSYCGHLCRIQSRDGNIGRHHSATAPQRCEAFLKTLGLFEDDISANDQMRDGR